MEPNGVGPETETLLPAGAARPKNREALFGKGIFVLLFLIVLGSLAGIGWGAYRVWQHSQVQSSALSIEGLQDVTIEEPLVTESLVDESVAPAPALPSSADLTASQTLAITILNGGAPAGTAAKVAEVLKQAGYTKVSTASSTGDFTGKTVYYASGKEKEAQALVATLAKSYEGVSAKPADAANKETATTPLVVVFGVEK